MRADHIANNGQSEPAALLFKFLPVNLSEDIYCFFNFIYIDSQTAVLNFYYNFTFLRIYIYIDNEFLKFKFNGVAYKPA